MPAPPTPLQQLLVRRDEVECPLLVVEPTVDQPRELEEALLHVSDMIGASRTQVVEVATMCLHCKRLPASKVEGEHGFTLCDACYFATGIDDDSFMQIPPRTAQDRMIAVLVARVHDLTTELAAARNALIGGS